MSNFYNPPWIGDLSRGFWDCGHWYDFPPTPVPGPGGDQSGSYVRIKNADGTWKYTSFKNDPQYVCDAETELDKILAAQPKIRPGILADNRHAETAISANYRLHKYMRHIERIAERAKISGVTEALYADLSEVHISHRIDAHDLKELVVDIPGVIRDMLIMLNKREYEATLSMNYKVAMDGMKDFFLFRPSLPVRVCLALWSCLRAF